MLVLASCSRDKDSSDPMLPEEGQWGGGTTGDQTMLVLQISPLDSQTTDQVPVERVNTLRIIIINKGDESHEPVIECNRLINDLPTTIASQLSYTLIWPTYEGKKDIYVIANEESLPDDFITALAVYNEKDAIDDNFKTQIQDYSFEPKYEIKDNSIYLPYTYYKDDLETKKNEVTNVAAYLVPVATKFIFNFTNKREAAVNVNSISLEAVNSQNYLFAKVGKTDSYKQLLNDDTKYYWVDWLAKVSELSHNHTGFTSYEDFNDYYGWIADYEIPTGDKSNTYHFVGNSASIPVVKVQGIEYAANGGNVVTVGPFYIPESKNMVQKDDEGKPIKEQEYYLTMELEDTLSENPPLQFYEIISNLKALFRNTYVIINVKMSQGDVEVYAEIAKWEHKSINGWVIEDK